MAVAGINLSLDTSEILQLQKALGKVFDNAGLAVTLESALERAIWPAYLRLQEVTPVGPTGNLKRAVAYKTVAYKRDGNAVGLIGYNRSGVGESVAMAGEGSTRIGKDRAFHQWWLEYGTRQRIVTTVSNKKYKRRGHIRRMKSGVTTQVKTHDVSGQNAIIASSFKKRGPVFNADGSQTPNSFFKKSKNPIVIPAMEPGGVRGRPPVQTAWNQTKGQAAEILTRELSLSLQQALEKLTYTSTGSVSGAVIQAGG